MAINFGNKSVENIQFGNTPIKSVYYGSTKVRPSESKIVIESDLTASTLQTLLADGWGGIKATNGYRLDENGLRCNGSSSNARAGIYYDVSNIINDIDNIEWEAEVYGNNGSWSGGYDSILNETELYDPPGQKEITFAMSFNNNSGYNNCGINVNETSKAVVGRNNPTGIYKLIGSASLKTGYTEYNLYDSGGDLILNKTYTLTSSELQQVKNNCKFCSFIISWGTVSVGQNNALKHAKLTITLSN